MQEVNKRDSLYVQLIKLLTVSMAAAAVFCCIVRIAAEYGISRYYEESSYVERRDRQYLKTFQEYVEQEQISTTDTGKISRWVDRQKVVTLQIYQDGVLMYDSNHRDREALWEEEIQQIYYDWEWYDSIHFADGDAEIVIYGTYEYQLYTYALIGSLLLSFGLFLTLVICGIRRKMAYIRLLGEEIEILEGGNLEYPITVRGKDELAQLAWGLDSMRRSFLEQVEQEAEMVQENQRIITEMSHDLRTPLTSIMLYTELLKKAVGSREKEVRTYIEKIDQKAHRIKQLSDHLFTYSLVSGSQEVKLEEPELFEVIFYDLFSEMGSYLEQNGFQVSFQIIWMEQNIRVNTEYISRIMDNISSNIVKYADPAGPVVIGSRRGKHSAGFFIENSVGAGKLQPEHAGIGIQSVRNMVMKMGGKCNAYQEGNHFRMEIEFPCVMG